MQAMDPALWELLEGNADDEIKSIIRLRETGDTPPGVRIVTRFGNIATVRLPRHAILDTHADETVASLKAPRLLTPEPDVHIQTAEEPADSYTNQDQRRPSNLPETGQGIIVGIIDWGCDFAHPNFRNADGSTRLLALWDQRGPSPANDENRYGYGVIHTTEAIKRALADDDPYQVLDYHPADGDPDGSGSHGTHVMDIAAGNGRSGGPSGIAPEADLIFVHLATEGTGGLATLGDSVTLLEAMDFIATTAGARPWVVNCSMGRHGGPHDGSTLVEQGLDEIVTAAPGRAIVQSTGNYFDRKIHASGLLLPGEQHTLIWQIDAADLTPNELEVWYAGRDTFLVEICSPDGQLSQRVALGESAALIVDEHEIGRIYHRAHDPNNLNHHVDAFLDPGAPAGNWEVTLTGADVVDGRYHAWVERDAACRHCQSRFDQADINPAYTTGTICNGFRTIAVGAYDARMPGGNLARFSSAGPTVDGRQKPNLVAPGVSILAARSASRELGPDTPLHTRKSGTSMAAPHVTGTIACMFEAAGRPLWIYETQNLLLSSTQKRAVSLNTEIRIGSGYLDIEAAVAAARHAGRYTADDMRQEATMNEELAAWIDANEAMVSDDMPLESTKKRNFIMISGGPGLYDDRDVEHDKSWANYVTPPLLLTDTAAKRKSFSASDEEIWWFIYKPAYVSRWADDLKAKRSATKAVKAKGFSSYVDLLEARAKRRGWNLRWLTSADNLWAKLKTFSNPISRVWYWGHARDDLWLTLAHSSASVAVSPDADAIITTSSITAHSSLKKHFQSGSSARVHRFVGCNTVAFAQTWATTFGVWAEGFEGKVDFSGIHASGGEPSLVGSATSKRYSSSGSAESDDMPWLDQVLFEDPHIDQDAAEQSAWDHSDSLVEGDADQFTPTRDLVELADAAITSDALPSAGALLTRLTPAYAMPARFPAPATLFETLTDSLPAARQHFDTTFEIVAYPGDPLPEQLQPGDLLVRRGEGGMAHLAMLADGGIRHAEELADVGLQAEVDGAGHYVQVIEAGPFPHTRADNFARRIARTHHLDHENLLVRLRPEAIEDKAIEMPGLDDDEGIAAAESNPEPRAIPTSDPVPFALEPPHGSFWPIITSHAKGHEVNYQAENGSHVGSNRSRRFLADRSNGVRYHAGIDLFANYDDPVVACEDGTILNFYGFCCGKKKTTNALFVEHDQVVVNYGEVAPDSLRRTGLSVGSTVRAGQAIGYIGRNPGGSSMLHFETYVKGTTANKQWMKGHHRPAALLNPTKYLLFLQEHGLAGSASGGSSGGGLSDLAARIQQALSSGLWSVALGLAIAMGQRDENKLTNLIFFARYPEHSGRKLDPNEPNFAQLRDEWLDIRNTIVRPILSHAPTTPTTPITPGGGATAADVISYTSVAGQPFGPKWKARRPPGLPEWARQASAADAAIPHVERHAREQGLGDTFVKAVKQMARTESGARFGLPANIFDARPKAERPEGKKLITAWGVFQFNRDAWTALIPRAERRSQRSWIANGVRGCASADGCVFPWDATPEEEITRPIEKYAALFRDVRAAGGSDTNAARGLRIWHISPAAYQSWLQAARRAGFSTAWRSLSSDLRERVTRFLERAGIA